jgi:hypothetical protein
MNSLISSLAIFTLLLLLFSPPAHASTNANEFMILYSNNVNGEIEPCG